ncbi:MAG: cupin domain-containing protein [Nitrospira sp.]|nr:cupin domain-containing protein [Nitrospira sp.]
MISVEQIKALLHLKPLPVEGGYFAETYRAQESLAKEALPPRYGGARSVATGIYYLLTPETFSAIHRLRSDEVYHFYLGDPVELLQLSPDGAGCVATLGADLLQGMQLQAVVPQGVWQGSRLRSGGRFALLGTTMAPGFDPADFEMGRRDELIALYPRFKETIAALTALA